MKHPCKRRTGRYIDFGYRQDPDDPNNLIPIDDHLDCLAEGLDLIRQGCTFREVADWISARTGVKLSHRNLWKKYKEPEYKAAKEKKRKARLKYYKKLLEDNGT